MAGSTQGKPTRIANAFDKMITGTASIVGVQALSSTRVQCLEVLLQNDPDSANSLFVGNQFNQFFELTAGTNVTIKLSDLGGVYVRSTGATVNWIAYV